MDLHAPSGGAASVVAGQRDQSLTPTQRRAWRLRANAVSVVVEALVKHRTLANRSIDLVSALGFIGWEQIRLYRNEEVRWSLRVLREYRLTADNHDILLDDVGCGTDYVFQVDTLHRSVGFADQAHPFGLRQRTRKRSVLAQFPHRLVVLDDGTLYIRNGTREQRPPLFGPDERHWALPAKPPVYSPLRRGNCLPIELLGDAAMKSETALLGGAVALCRAAS